MSFDQSMQATTSRLINRRGKSVAYLRVGNGTYDPATSRVTTNPVSYALKALVEPFKMRQTTKDDLIQPGDYRVTIAGLDVVFTPATGDKITVDGIQLTIMTPPLQTYAGELVATWLLHARKA